MPVTALPVAAQNPLSSTGTFKPTPPPTSLRIVPAYNDESDHARWNVVQEYIQKDFDTHHVEVLNPHTKQYQPNYAVHALLAFYKINASETVVRERYELESKMLDKVGAAAGKVEEGNWKEFLGKGQSMYSAYTQFFLSEIQKHGINGTITKYLPTLIPGLGPDCFHPLVHLGLGLEYQHPLIVAQGLAFWAYTHTPIVETMPPTVDDEDTATVLEILQDVREDTRFDPENIHPHWGTLEYHKRVRKAVGSQLGMDLAELVGEFKVDATKESVAEALEQLTDAAVLACTTTAHPFPAQLDFPLTHALVATHSLHTIIPYLSLTDQTHLLKRFLLTYLAVYTSQGRPNLHPDRLDTIYTPDEELDNPTSLMSTSPPLGSPTLPRTPATLTREWQTLAGAPAHVDDDIHVMEACAALYAFEARYGEKGGLYVKAAKTIRSIVRTGSGEEWEFRGAGYPPASSFLLEEEE